MGNEAVQTQHIVTTPTKSVGISILLILLFGPIGLFYSTVKGAILFTIIFIVLVLIALVVNPMLLLVVGPVMWVVSLVWGAMAVKSYNQKLLEQV